MIRTSYLPLAAAALLLGACAQTSDLGSTTSIQDKSVPAGTATYFSGSAGTASNATTSSASSSPGTTPARNR